MAKEKICNNCRGSFPSWKIFDGKLKCFSSRKYCFECVPVGKRMRQRTSPIWQMDSGEFSALVARCNSFKEIIESFGREATGGNYTTLRKRIKHIGISTDHIQEHYRAVNTSCARLANTRSLESILVENSTYNSTNNLKQRLIKEGLLEEKCSKCGLLPVWQGQRLSLQLDHVNGVSNDNRIENLRILCPNCHTQTETFCRRSGRTLHRCTGCGVRVTRLSKICRKCMGLSLRDKHAKISWPSDEELLRRVQGRKFAQVGREIGVSDNCIRKRLKSRGLT